MEPVLVVDDDSLVRETMCELLADLGCRSTPVADGGRALKLLESDPFDLVVSDVDMPEMSGFELLARVQHLGLSMPVVLMSARADDRLQHAAQSAGARYLFAKPVPAGPFAALVESLLRPHG